MTSKVAFSLMTVVAMSAGLIALRPTTTATLPGASRDTSGAVMPEATISVSKISTGATRQPTTDGEGRSTLTHRGPGPYQVRAKRAGFSTAKSNVPLLQPLSTRLAIPCADLMNLSLAETTITAAHEVPAGSYTPPGSMTPLENLPAFCRVALTVAPAVRIEVWMPKDTWNQRYRGEGGGGYAGSISYGGLANGIRAGYATASTDTGHPASVGGTFALNPDGTLNNQLIFDFAERSLHDGAQGQGADQRVLRHGTEVLVLEWLLHRRPPGLDGGAAFSGGVRRTGDRRARDQLGPLPPGALVAADRHARGTRRPDQRREIDRRHERSHRRLRC
jgi:hypothetical protein